MSFQRRVSAMLAATLCLAGSASAGPPKVRDGSSVTVVPFELRDNLVRIPVDVNGQRRSGVLDSGAGAVLVDRQVSETLGLSSGAPTGDAAGAGNEAKALRPIAISLLESGPFQFKDLAAYAVDLGNLSSSAGFPIDVILGAPAFEAGTVSVDYARRRVTVDRSRAAPGCAVPIPLEIVHAAPVIEIMVRPADGEPPVRLKVLVDLGTRHSALVLGGPFLRSDAGIRLARNAVAKEVGFGVGGSVRGAVARVADVRAGASSFGPMEVSLTSNVPAFEGTGIDGTLGVPLWKGGAITFDYAGRRLCITRPKTFSRAPSGDAGITRVSARRA